MKSKKPSGAHERGARTSRRKFTKAVATTLMAAPLAASSLAQAQKPTGTKEATAPPNPQPATQTQPPSPLAEAYAEVVRRRFGERLTPEEFEQVKRDLQSNIQSSERLRAVKLKNEDEPDFVFSAD
jgi:hypothetical protein